MAARVGALLLAVLVSEVHLQAIEFYNPNIQYPVNPPLFGYQTPQSTQQQVTVNSAPLQVQWPQSVVQQASTVNVDEVSVDVDISSVNSAYSQTYIQPSAGAPIVNPYAQPKITSIIQPQPGMLQVQWPQSVVQQASTVNVDEISVDLDISSVNSPYSQTVIQPSAGAPIVNPYAQPKITSIIQPQPGMPWPPTFTSAFGSQASSPTFKSPVPQQRPQAVVQQASTVNFDEISVDVDISSVNSPYSQTTIQPIGTPIYKQYQQPTVLSSYPSALQQQTVGTSSLPPTTILASQAPQSTFQQVNINSAPVPFPRPQFTSLQQTSAVNVDDISVDIDISSVNAPQSQTVIGTPWPQAATILPQPLQQLNLLPPVQSFPTSAPLPRPQIVYSSPPIIEQPTVSPPVTISFPPAVQPITITELPQPTFVSSPVFAPALIPSPTVVQTPTVPLVSTTVVDNSLANSLANVLQLLLASRFIDSQINPYTSTLLNTLSTIGTTSVYSPLIECNLIDSVYGYDTVSPFQSVNVLSPEIVSPLSNIFGSVADYPVTIGVPELSPILQYTQEYYTSPVLAEVIFPSYIPAQITCNFAPMIEPISAYEQLGIYF